jgi:phage terminase small subunit
MARPLTPTAVLEQNGAFEHDPQRRAAREGEPAGRGVLGDPPERFTPLQRDAWYELELLAPEGVLTGSDRVMVEMYCQLVARMRGEPDAEGYPRPLKAAEFTQLLNILGRLGMTPSDRARLKVPEKSKKPANRFAAMAADSNDVQ